MPGWWEPAGSSKHYCSPRIQQAIQDSPMLSCLQRATSEKKARSTGLNTLGEWPPCLQQPIYSRLLKHFVLDTWSIMTLDYSQLFGKALGNQKPCFRIAEGRQPSASRQNQDQHGWPPALQTSV